MTITQKEATTIAQSIVVVLCGSRVVYPSVEMIDEYPLTQTGRINLSGRPVLEIVSVKIDGVPEDYKPITNGFILQLLNAPYRLACEGQATKMVEVQYVYGYDVLPPVMKKAIDDLAAEIVNADSNPDDCRFPERVTNVTRQGVSWTVIDPQDFLQDGRTGIYSVDLAIKTLNPKNARRRARVFSVDFGAPALRRLPS